MGGAADMLVPKEGLAGQALKAAGVTGKKKKKKPVNAQAQKNLAAKSAAPLLQQTALSPDEPSNTGAGTALL
jgi:hypothetical protein